MTKAVILVENLVKKFDHFIAVNDISFSIKKGEIFGILGPNGAGKTTTIEILETITEKTSGNVKIFDLDIKKDRDAIIKNIGTQFQEQSFYPKLTLKQLIGQFAVLYKLKKIDAEKYLDDMDLLDKKNVEYIKLSGGQKQRFSLLISMINNPKIIFLDEPSTGLDPQARRNLWQKIKSIKQNGTTVVLSTHFMDEAEFLCDRLIILDKGKIIAQGTPDQMIEELDNKLHLKKEMVQRRSNLEDVFIDLTGASLTQ